MSEESPTPPCDDEADKTPGRPITERLGYVASLPERALRTGTGLLGGMVRESASLLVPRSFQNSRTYSVMVRQMLDFLVHDVGRVASSQQSTSSSDVDNFVARKAVGNFIDMASLATLHVSPVLFLAALSDLAYGSQVYLNELSAELKAQGVIDQDARIDHVNDLLSAVSDASAATTTVFNTPPLSVQALRATIDETRAAIGSADLKQILPQADIQKMWDAMRDVSRRDGVGLLAVSGAVTMGALGKVASIGHGALSTVKVAGSLFDRHVLDHYVQSLKEIRSKGFYASLAETSEPYFNALWQNFQPKQSTLTEDLISGRTFRAVRRWLGRDDSAADNGAAPSE
jgi:hypothetical protein